MNLTNDFRNTLYDVLDDMSVGNVPFGVLKTFYANDVHKLYNELINTIPNDKMKELETVLLFIQISKQGKSLLLTDSR